MESSYSCDLCQDTGWIMKPQENMAPIAVSCKCREMKKLKAMWMAAGINPELSKLNFSNFEIWNVWSQKARDTAAAYYKDFNNICGDRHNSILLCGQVGSGKTHLCVALALNFIKKEIPVVYMPYRGALTKLKQNIKDEDYYRRELLKYQSCQVLLIDDVFKGKVTEFDINIVFEIVNYRYLNCLPIIVSTEYTVDELLNFDEAIGSRIYEMCKFYTVEIERSKSNNYRLREQE